MVIVGIAILFASCSDNITSIKKEVLSQEVDTSAVEEECGWVEDRSMTYLDFKNLFREGKQQEISDMKIEYLFSGELLDFGTPFYTVRTIGNIDKPAQYRGYVITNNLVYYLAIFEEFGEYKLKSLTPLYETRISLVETTPYYGESS